MSDSRLKDEAKASRRLRDRGKNTNPKDAIGSAKVPLGLLSPIAKAHWAAAQHLGRI